MLHLVQIGKPCDKNHGRFADREKHPLTGSVRHAPSRPPGEVDRVFLGTVKAQYLEHGTVVFISDGGGDRQRVLRQDRDAIWSKASFEDGPRFQTQCVNPSQACRPPVGYEDHPVVRHNPCSFWESRQRRDVSARVMIDDLDAVAPRVCQEDAAALWIESTMIERAARTAWYLDRANGLQRHDHLECLFSACSRHQVWSAS